MKLRIKQLEHRVIGEAMGWHARKPYSLHEWMATPDALLAYLTRIDAACEELLQERQKAKLEAKKRNDATLRIRGDHRC